MSNPAVLFYNMNSEKGRKLKLVCLKLKLKIKMIEPAQYHQPIGYLAGVNGIEPMEGIFTGDAFTDEMLVFKDFDNRLLDAFLSEFKKNRIERVALKAVLTEQNLTWDSVTLHDELVQEHEAMSQN